MEKGLTDGSKRPTRKADLLQKVTKLGEFGTNDTFPISKNK